MDKREKLVQTETGFDNNRISYFEELITPLDLQSIVPNNFYLKKKINNQRTIVENIINKKDNRLFIIVTLNLPLPLQWKPHNFALVALLISPSISSILSTIWETD